MSFCVMPYAVDADHLRGCADWSAVEARCRAHGRALPNDQFAGFGTAWLDDVPAVHDLLYAGYPVEITGLARPDDLPLVAHVTRDRFPAFRASLEATDRVSDTELANEINMMMAREVPPLQVFKRVREMRGCSLSEARALVKQHHLPGNGMYWLRKAKERERRGPSSKQARREAYAQARAWLDAADADGVDLVLFMY